MVGEIVPGDDLGPDPAQGGVEFLRPRDAGKGDGGLTTPEREELSRLRSENRKLKEEREILSKAAAWFATESGTSKRSSGS